MGKWENAGHTDTADRRTAGRSDFPNLRLSDSNDSSRNRFNLQVMNRSCSRPSMPSHGPMAPPQTDIRWLSSCLPMTHSCHRTQRTLCAPYRNSPSRPTLITQLALKTKAGPTRCGGGDLTNLPHPQGLPNERRGWKSAYIPLA